MATRAVLLDVDGVLVESWQPIPGAADTLRALRASGLTVELLTNTTSRTAADVAGTLRAAGFKLDDGELLTAGVATSGYLATHHEGRPCLVLNDGPLDDLGDVRLAGADERPEVVVVGSGGPSFTWARVNDAARALVDGAALVAMHGTMAWQTTEGVCVDGGAYVTALERATGVRATVVGKPAPAMFTEALRRAGVDADEAMMVGDDLATDVLAAQAVGIAGVLVRTGKFRPESLDAASARPYAVIDSIADLPTLLQRG